MPDLETGLRPEHPVRASVVIPAHNEESVIGRCLQALFGGGPRDDLQVIVVCNGCTDRTAEVAAGFGEAVKVVELATPSKTAALNEGDKHASVFPRIYLDADVELPRASWEALVETLRDVPCAAPEPWFELSDRPWTVRSFYRTWQTLPYLKGQVVGNGVYALSEEGRKRFGEFPDLIADDLFVMQLFQPVERRTLRGKTFRIHPPREVRSLLRIRTRVYRGNRQLARSRPVGAPEAHQGPVTPLLRALTRPLGLPAVVCYLGVNSVAKIAARRPDRGWERDDSARRPATPDTGEGTGSVPDMHIAYLTSRYPKTSHTFVREEIRTLRESGVRVQPFSVRAVSEDELVSDADRRELATTQALLPVPVRRLVLVHLAALWRTKRAYLATLSRAWQMSPPGPRGRLWRLFYFAEAVLMWDHCRRLGIRRIHAHMANVAADVAELATFLGRCSEPGRGWGWTFTMHGPTEFFDVERYRLADKVHDADSVICISNFCRSQLQIHTHPGDWGKLTVVHCGVDLEVFSERSGWAQEQQQRPPLRLISVGRLVPEKGHLVLLDAVAELDRRHIPFSLTVAGSGPEQERLQARATHLGLESLVAFAGDVDHTELPVLLSRSDVFVLASFAEGVPVVLMEAMASGLPVVTTRIAGIPELVRDGEDGLLVTPGDAMELADALERLSRSEDERHRLGSAGRLQVKRHFEVRACAMEVASVLEAAAEAASR